MYPLIAPAPAWAVSTGLLLVRLVVGAAFVLHGLPKIQNPSAGWAGWRARPRRGSRRSRRCSSSFGGILLVAGLATRISALALASVMIGALALVHIPQR